MTQGSGPLTGVRVIEIAGLGAGPYAAMLLADLGADVIRVDRPGTRSASPEKYALSRGRRSIIIDLKKPDGLAALLTLVQQADLMFEGFRPGVAEKLGFGPATCLERNPALVYGRMTGWGQDGPMAQMAGHDLNYLGLTGALQLLARPGGQPASPPGFIADFGGGGLMLAFGLVCALLESRSTGVGQVVDAAMVDGVASLTTLVHAMMAQGRWREPPGTNFCDGGAPYYDSYETSDGGYVAVAPIEPQFYGIMVDKLGLALEELPDRDDPANWPELKRRFAGIFRSRTRAHWAELFDGSDACVTPVLSFTEAVAHPHNVARMTYPTAFGVRQPTPAPRFGRNPGSISGPPPLPGEHSREVLADWGFAEPDIHRLIDAGAVVGSP
ncbi:MULTISPECIES: CaiB/BaiF CoA transferase family protein [Mycolicibacter]|uniref:CoA transferase n=1 Tax=Mycolicibacter kumamotonensis TaxID=354243 RepID=A0A7K3L6I9_9MYCO|nr:MULTISPECIES: CaiB/BaiF CoA-transferase family protein [Mycolicibacter]NDJ88024.1 CoA transferase [Mycolicibacter kumamotonensis]RAV02836.1 CoA transferase [Mycolicibacter senuensis]